MGAPGQAILRFIIPNEYVLGKKWWDQLTFFYDLQMAIHEIQIKLNIKKNVFVQFFFKK